MNQHEFIESFSDLLAAWPYPALSERQHQLWARTLAFHDRSDFQVALDRHLARGLRQRPNPTEFAQLMHSLGMARRQREDQTRREAERAASETEWQDASESRGERATRHIAEMRALLPARRKVRT